MKRDIGLDAIRVVLTALVVVHHISIAYGGAGSWYWKEARELNLGFMLFNAINQSFFMGFFFLLAGYFALPSLQHKGVKKFLLDRMVRLGIPLAVYFFLLAPFTIALANPSADVSLLAKTLSMIKALEFEPGPLWFVFALLIFSFGLAGIYSLKPSWLGSIKQIPRFIKMLAALLAIGLCAFGVRLLVPVGQTVASFQLGYFPMYILLFALGVLVAQPKLLSAIKFGEIKIWLVISVVAIIVLPLALIFPVGDGPFEGGVNLNALFYALWEPLVACGIILGLLVLFNSLGPRAARVFTRLSPLAYGVFIIHPPVVVAISLLLAPWQQGLVIKFLVNCSLSLLACVVLSYLIVHLPYARRVL